MGCAGSKDKDGGTASRSANPEGFPEIQGKVIQRPADGKMTPDWQAHVYGYAASNYQNDMNPAAIVYTETVEDVQAVVKWATEREVAVAVRSGSHHYLGACSTTGNNIQIDLSSLLAAKPEATPWKALDIDAKSGLVTMGPGVSLGILATELDKNGLWVPFGECSSVFAGGHAQSGGSSPALWTYGGYLVDHIQSYTLVLASGELKTVHRDAGKNTSEEENNLFWAIAGASPGNFGIVTSITVQCKFNADYDDVIEFGATINPKTNKPYRNVGLYTKARLLRMMTLWSKVNDELDLPADQQIMPYGAKFGISQMATAGPKHHDGVDDAVKSYNKGQFFDRAAAENKKIGKTAMNQVPNTLGVPLFLCAITVFVKKDLPDEEKAALKEKALSFFATVDEALDWGILSEVGQEAISVIGSVKNVWEEIVAHFKPKDDKGHKLFAVAQPDFLTMSQISLANTHFIEKEHLRKWQKMNVYGGINSETGKPILYNAATKTSAFAQFVADEYEKIEGLAGAGNSLKADVSLLIGGGPGSKPPADGRNFAAFRSGPAVSWCEITAWWGPTDEEGAFAEEWMANMRKNLIAPETGLYATKQMMNLGLPWGSNQMDSEELRFAYWQDETTYQRILVAKKSVDPTWTFTANPYGIGASNPEAASRVNGTSKKAEEKKEEVVEAAAPEADEKKKEDSTEPIAADSAAATDEKKEEEKKAEDKPAEDAPAAAATEEKAAAATEEKKE